MGRRGRGNDLEPEETVSPAENRWLLQVARGREGLLEKVGCPGVDLLEQAWAIFLLTSAYPSLLWWRLLQTCLLLSLFFPTYPACP